MINSWNFALALHNTIRKQTYNVVYKRVDYAFVTSQIMLLALWSWNWADLDAL